MGQRTTLAKVEGRIVKSKVAEEFLQAGFSVEWSVDEGYDMLVGTGNGTYRVRARTCEGRSSQDSVRFPRRDYDDCDFFASYIEDHGVWLVPSSEVGSRYSISVKDPETMNEYNRERTHFIDNHRVADFF